ncbi:FUSC family protein [Streptomyces sp. CAU 1734]|uniref:FUSC family protein n=1 Tax=Streptomyces sp. CAU 1734 TaxID=3140360 RepID=UPI003260B8B5
MTWLRALKETTRSGFTLERQRLEPLVALRAAAGLAIVVGAALALFGPAVAVSSAFGAHQAAIATFQRSWRPRPLLALASGGSLAVSTFLGYLVAGRLPLFTALLFVWTFAAGLAWALGPTVGIIAASNVAIMLVTITLPSSIATAAGHAAMIAVGGLVQAALIVVFPVRRWGAQRDALADALAAEADYARRLRQDPTASFDPEPLMLARSAAALSPRQARRRPAELHGARGVAERIRPVLASLADPAVGVPADGPERDRCRELLGAAGTVLDAAAHAIRHGEPVRIDRRIMRTLKSPDTLRILSGPPRRAVIRLVALLDDVVEEAEGEGTGEGSHRDRPPLRELLPGAVATIRGEFRRGRPVLRHAERVSVVVCAGYILGTALPLGHGYWVPMTAVMVMRPDFSQTYARSVARFGGTLIGVGVATGIVQAAHPGTYLSCALAVLCAFGMYLVTRTGYVAAQVFTAAYVVFLLGMGGEDTGQTVPERVLLTLFGGVLAMVAYAVYPAWETPRLRHRLADWLLADGRYAACVVDHYAVPAVTAKQDIRQALLGARDARIAWQDALALAIHEPVRNRGLTRVQAEAAEHALAHFGRSAMLMEAHLPEHGAPMVPAAAALSEALRRDTERAAKAVRERRPLQWDRVKAALAEWQAQDHAVLESGTALLGEALDELADALDDGRRRRNDGGGH